MGEAESLDRTLTPCKDSHLMRGTERNAAAKQKIQEFIGPLRVFPLRESSERIHIRNRYHRRDIHTFRATSEGALE
jgi:hypothetical protein